MKLDPPNSPTGAMERLFILETRTPAFAHTYNEADSLKAMRYMRQVIENRLKASAQWGARNAKDEVDIIAIGNQFEGFGDYPVLPASKESILADALRIANSPGDARSPIYTQFVQDAITAATEVTPGSVLIPNLVAWRSGPHSPGPRFKVAATVQGNTFYTVDPVPPMPKRRPKPHHGPPLNTFRS